MCVSAFNSFGRETGFTFTLCQAEKFVGGRNFPSHFLGAGTEGLKRVLGTSIGVNRCGSGGNDGEMFLVDSVYGRISMYS